MVAITSMRVIACTSLAFAVFHDTSAAPVKAGTEIDIALNKRHPANAVISKPVIPTRDDNNKTVVNKHIEGSATRLLEAKNSGIGNWGSWVYNLDALSKYSNKEVLTIPWTASYWPTAFDGINFQWNDDKSAAVKYAEAYGLNVNDFTKAISESSGVLSQSDAGECQSDADCTGGEVCGKRLGENKGKCIPGWYGVCHAWTPASMLEPEPKCSVEVNGVVFYVMDIKALLIQMYHDADVDTHFWATRFYGPDSPRIVDDYGRYTDSSRLDLDPATLHTAMTNILGKHGQSFIIDQSADSPVWNQPVRSYSFNVEKILKPEEAAQKYFEEDKYPFNEKAKKIAYVKTTLRYIVVGNVDGPLVSSGRMDDFTKDVFYEYLLELDEDDNIIGGEWIGDSRYEHPDFLWVPKGRPSGDATTKYGLSYKNVRSLLERSLACNDDSFEAATVTTPYADDSDTIQWDGVGHTHQHGKNSSSNSTVTGKYVPRNVSPDLASFDKGRQSKSNPPLSARIQRIENTRAPTTVKPAPSTKPTSTKSVPAPSTKPTSAKSVPAHEVC